MQLDKQLTQNPEECKTLIEAKEKVQQFEEELIHEGVRRRMALEIDVQSWTKGNVGHPDSWIRIGNCDKRLPGSGIGCVCVDIGTGKVVKQLTFNLQATDTDIDEKFAYFLKSVNEDWLLIMCLHDEIQELGPSTVEILKQLGVSNDQIPLNENSFIYIGRPSKTKIDPYFACVCRGPNKGPCNVRRVVILDDDTSLTDVCSAKTSSVPPIIFESRTLSHTLDKHLKACSKETIAACQK
ncbi:hypothetical protein RFI_10948 [Reticulomyxa filosa]|uniref:ILEI/PANDER domain-containing protein n=1 Tax=Reticulomyxa filosa TaxID=46433 RepID=X6NKC5_RETFI|nr:hypothetical protein RFI_10948 [Reticulomyxa filosa]|eukprot:ETO26189.1 hypothetical protein RFI_10948 [Reticulomyxa filosa]